MLIIKDQGTRSRLASPTAYGNTIQCTRDTSLTQGGACLVTDGPPSPELDLVAHSCSPIAALSLSSRMAGAFTSWLLFLAVLVNQSGRVMVPSVMTAILADPHMPVDADVRATYLALVSAVCLGGKFLGGAVTDTLGGWLVLIAVFLAFAASSALLITTHSANAFGAAWLINSLAYTITWGAACQVIGAAYDEKERPAQLTKIASASRLRCVSRFG